MTSLRLFLAVLAVLLAQPANSDELRPGYLEMRQTGPGAYNLLFKIPARGEDLRLAIYVKLPEGTQDITPPAGVVQRGCLCRTPLHSVGWRAHRAARNDRGSIGHIH